MFAIFDLAFPKIVDPTIFIRESFIFAGNFLAHRAGARRRRLSRASRGRVVPQVHVAAWSRSSIVAAIDLLASRRCNKNDAAMDLLAGVASHEGRRGGGDGSPSLVSLQQKEAAMDLLRPRAKKGGGARGKENSRVRGLVSRETTTTWGVRTR